MRATPPNSRQAPRSLGQIAGLDQMRFKFTIPIVDKYFAANRTLPPGAVQVPSGIDPSVRISNARLHLWA
jgi:hypothetical protein